MSLPSQSAPRPNPETKEPWRFEGAVDHAPALRRLKAPVDRGQLQRCLPLPAITTACHACAGERTALSCRPRRSRRPSAPWSGGGDLSAGSSHRSVQTCAYHLKTLHNLRRCTSPRRATYQQLTFLSCNNEQTTERVPPTRQKHFSTR